MSISPDTLAHLRSLGVSLPSLSELADPSTISPAIVAEVAGVDRDAAHPRNLYRVHWYNDPARGGWSDLPASVELPSALTGVAARIVVLLGERFPMIDTHKVLAAYACLVPRLVSGEFHPLEHRAVWPSTGNYCRGGIAISRILGCRGVAVLPEGMSAERFRWLERWVSEPEDIVRTPGTESNVKEIYDACKRLAEDPRNVILNQFSEYGNYLVHRECTGRAAGRLFESLAQSNERLELAAFVAATGSAGTLGAGDHLKEAYGSRIVAVEALECPTLLRNGFGEHNIQGIGDKHVPLIHNVMNTDALVGISDRSTDELHLLFNTAAGREYLRSRRGLAPTLVERLASLGLSSIANVLAAIRFARHFDLDEESVVMTVATDNASLYLSQLDTFVEERFGGEFDLVNAGEAYGEHLAGLGASELEELRHADRTRIFNLGYYTWVEQQGVSVEDFERRRRQAFWDGLRSQLPAWDEAIEALNAQLSSS